MKLNDFIVATFPVSGGIKTEVFMNDRKFITTAEFAQRLAIKEATAQRSHCINGHYLGIRPVKLPNRRLLWPLAEVEKLMASTQ